MKAVILAAGRGTRLGDLTRNIPKPMVKVAGKPVLEHIIQRVKNAGINDFVLVTRYLSEKIESYFEDGSRWGIRIQYVLQPENQYGTGAALKCTRDIIDGDELMMTYGDVITPSENYAGAMEVYKTKSCDGVLTLNWVDDPCNGAAVFMDEDGRVKNIVEKPPKGTAESNWNSAGIFVFNSAIFDYLDRLTPSSRGEYELPDAMNAMIADGRLIYPYYLKGAWRDVGRIEDIAAAEEILSKENPLV